MTEKERRARESTIIECLRALELEAMALIAEVNKLTERKRVLDRECDQLVDAARALRP